MSLDVRLPGPSGWKARVAGKSQKRRGVGCMRVGEPLLLPLRCPLPPAAASPSAVALPSAVACVSCGGESDIAGSDAGSDVAREASRRSPPLPDFEICTQTQS